MAPGTLQESFPVLSSEDRFRENLPHGVEGSKPSIARTTGPTDTQTCLPFQGTRQGEDATPTSLSQRGSHCPGLHSSHSVPRLSWGRDPMSIPS